MKFRNISNYRSGIYRFGIIVIFAFTFIHALTVSAIGEFQVRTAICSVDFTPDLPVMESNEIIEAEIDLIVEKYQDEYLGQSAPSSGDLASAVNSYNSLGIELTDGTITGKIIKNTYKDVKFLKTFASHLRFQPNDSIIREKANNTVWLVSDQICKGSLSGNLYYFDDFSRPAALLSRFFNDTLRSLFSYAMNEYGVFEHFWEPVFDQSYMSEHDGVSTDHIYILGESLMIFAANQLTPDERYLWMRGFKRWVERFTTYSPGTANGIKPDGTGFHHWTAYDNYMYAFKKTSSIFFFLSETSFQIAKPNYLRFRDAVFAQIIYANNKQLKPLAMAGRKPHQRESQYSSKTLKQLAISGGHILGLETADTILAGEYNRIFGVDPDFKYDTVAPVSNTSGFFQFNYANLGIFRKDDWLVGMKGFSNGLWGSELYPTTNRYGRYQSYGTLEIIYPGSENFGNGYQVGTWNWNYNPGATTIVLPWDKLHGEYARIDEYQEKGFCGALAFENTHSTVLSQTHGNVGGFAMAFQEKEGLGFSTYYGPNSHNKTFRWKKSTWAFDDMIIALGSNINNDGSSTPTVTTLFQRLENSTGEVLVNGTVQDQSITLDGVGNNWIISNYSTGFYVFNNGDEVTIWNGEQQTPNHDQIDPSAYVNNAKARYWIGTISHGINPADASYEYMVIPNATKEIMDELDQEMKSDRKPYKLYQKDNDAHILEHNSGIWGYAIFNSDVEYNLPGLVKNVSYPCLIMLEPSTSNDAVKIAVSNPDLGIDKRSYAPIKAKTISFELESEFTLYDTSQVNIIDVIVSDGNTVITVTTNHGLPVEFELSGTVPDYTKAEERVIRNQSFKVYPNPVENMVWLEGEFTSDSKWELYNALGASLLRGTISLNKYGIDISDLNPGVYFICVSDNNHRFDTRKIVVK